MNEQMKIKCDTKRGFQQFYNFGVGFCWEQSEKTEIKTELSRVCCFRRAHTLSISFPLSLSSPLTADRQSRDVEEVSIEAGRFFFLWPAAVRPQALLQAAGDLLQCDSPIVAAGYRQHCPEVSHNTPLPAENKPWN